MNKRLKRIAQFLLGAVAINAILAMVTNVSTAVTESDEIVFQYVLKLSKPIRPISYVEELQLIRMTQQVVLSAAPMGDPIKEDANREPIDLIRKQSGLCYDRSRTYDKIFAWMGFKTRHVYILYPEHPDTKKELPFWRAFLTKGTQTHAVTEVKTSKGWLLVDSNSTWISATKLAEPVLSEQIKTRSNEFHAVPAYLNKNFWVIKGMYSRRGQFYRPFLLYPELNWADFFAWQVGIDGH